MINFVKYNKKMLILSFVLILSSLSLIAVNGFNFSIDFKGGTLTELKFENDVNTDNIKNYLHPTFKEVSVVHYGSADVVVIQTPLEADYKGVGNKIYEMVKKNRPSVEIVRTEFIGPKVGEELKTNGILALLIVIIGILIYVSISFEFKFAIGAVLALTHDLLITAGFISLTQINVDLTVLAAMLAILGYSLNDTIIVYDRIRENINKMESEKLSDVINTSLNETLSRTIMTSLTTSVTLISLLFFGGESLSAFSIVLLFGIVVGTYSSIYIASGLLSFIGIKKTDFNKEKVDRENGVV